MVIKTKKIAAVYAITNPNLQKYVGASTDVYRRWKQYKRLNNKSQPKLLNSFIKHGVENHNFEVLIQCNQKDLPRWELHYGKLFNVLGSFGLNGSIPGIKSEESKQNTSKALKGKYSAEKSPMYGKRHSDSTKLKISQSKLGEKHPNYGKSFSGGKGPSAKKVICVKTNKIYPCAKDAALALGIKISTMNGYLNGRFKNKTTLRYL